MVNPTHTPLTTVRIPLRDGKYAIVDRGDAELIAGFNWKMLGNGYVMAHRAHFSIYLHRLIAGAGPDELVDHINRDPLDNRAVNLRIATSWQNSGNRGPDRRRLGTSSRHKGVSWSRHKNRWRAYIHIDGRTRCLGTFTDEDDAARAYNVAALAHWGSFARLNDVPDRP
jgi:hypothetical protein